MTHISDEITITNIPVMIEHYFDPMIIWITLGGVALLLVSTAIWKLNRRLKRLEK